MFYNSAIEKIKKLKNKIICESSIRKYSILVVTLVLLTFLTYFCLNGLKIGQFTVKYIQSNLYNVLIELSCILFLYLFLFLVIYDIKVNKNKQLLVIIRTALIMALISSFLMQFFQLGLFIDTTFIWIADKYWIFIINILVMFFIYMGLISITSLFWGSSIGFIIMFLISLTNLIKMNILGQPLYPIDFYQLKNFDEIVKFVGGNLVIYFIGIAVFIAIMIHISKKVKKYKLKRRYIFITLSLAVAFIGNCVSPTDIEAKNLYTMAGANYIAWDQMGNYHDNGTIFAMLSNLSTNTMDKPSNYSKEEIDKIVMKYEDKAQKYNKGITENSVKPNIIYIMSESFWDPSRLSCINFSDDPIKNIREGMESNFYSGYTLSPSFGGSTSNVEFEALTGFSNYNLKDGAVPYQQSIRKEFPSVVSLLKDDGYKTLAMHPFFKSTYKRTYVYKDFGFDDYIGQDDMKYTNKIGQGEYISDNAVTKEIEYLIESNNDPLFLHTVTMQNHMNYFKGKNGEESITASYSGLSSENKDLFEIYAQGIKQSDEALKELLDYVKKSSEPTIVVFWGDHLPYFANCQDVKKSDFIKSKSELEESKFFSETPLLYYANFDIKKQSFNTQGDNYISLNTFNYLGKKISPYYALLQSLEDKFKGIKKTVKLDSSGDIIKGDLSNEEKNLLEEYKLIQYDVTEGKRYSLKDFFTVDK